MGTFRTTKSAAIIRKLSPMNDRYGYDFQALRWSMIWTLAVGIVVTLLLRERLDGAVGYLFLVSVTVSIVGLMLLISAAHGNYFGDSSLTRRERKGAKALKARRPVRAKARR